MNILIDGDILTYRAACAVQTATYTYKDAIREISFHGLTKKEILAQYPDLPESDLKKAYSAEPVSHALQICKTMAYNIIEEIEETYEIDNVKIYLTSDDKSNFRYKVAKTKPYKGNRKDPKPIHYEAVREYLIKKFNAEVVYGMEADDRIGIEATKAESVIVSIDKDLDMIPGWHYNFVKKEMYSISEKTAYYNFYKQLLVGDPTDNIPGLKGIGPKKAAKILSFAYMGCPPRLEDWDPDSLDPEVYRKELELLVRQEYLERGQTVEYFQEMKDLLWILREPHDEQD